MPSSTELPISGVLRVTYPIGDLDDREIADRVTELQHGPPDSLGQRCRHGGHQVLFHYGQLSVGAVPRQQRACPGPGGVPQFHALGLGIPSGRQRVPRVQLRDVLGVDREPHGAQSGLLPCAALPTRSRSMPHARAPGPSKPTDPCHRAELAHRQVTLGSPLTTRWPGLRPSPKILWTDWRDVPEAIVVRDEPWTIAVLPQAC